MNKLRHHPSSELLAAYASGTHSMSYGLTMATHLETCEHCRESLSRLQLLDAHYFSHPGEVADVSIDVKNKVLAAIVAEEDVESISLIEPDLEDFNLVKQKKYEAIFEFVPRCLLNLLPDDPQQLKWVKIGSSIRSVIVCIDNYGNTAELYHIKAGAKVAKHTHQGEELTVVLSGSFNDGICDVHQGDFVVYDQRHEHQPIAGSEKDCFCLAVSSSPIRFTGFYSRWFNPLNARLQRESILKS